MQAQQFGRGGIRCELIDLLRVGSMAVRDENSVLRELFAVHAARH